ncbi:hypothetical protein Cabys_2525 [Caldithrix abyssi DSM 13497]|uniref:Uncharacterized protein n=1 Tax=Caldithrix abyssi DSM 13497 TaxID=880073 RepID=A0A1J1CBA6_CALAY|nr:hypothetical protein Cabys_2525 [Caldithrix abyssi DSM 13497]
MMEIIFLVILVFAFIFFLFYSRREGRRLHEAQRRLKNKIKDHYR